jgi:hypothetical protein
MVRSIALPVMTSIHCESRMIQHVTAMVFSAHVSRLHSTVHVGEVVHKITYNASCTAELRRVDATPCSLCPPAHNIGIHDVEPTWSHMPCPPAVAVSADAHKIYKC